MSAEMERPDVDRVLSGLKDFQRRTVDYVFDRLYTNADRSHRFLVADEVGLGKTLIARGIVARTIDHLWDKVGRIDIVYICSSGDIARQNVNRLNITGRADWALASRVTMLPTQLKEIQTRKVNFVAFTPGTTFNLGSSAGQGSERVLLYWLLKHAWGFEGAGPKNLLQAWMGYTRFRNALKDFDPASIDPTLEQAFHKALQAHDERAFANGERSLKSRFEELSDQFGRARQHIPHDERLAQNAIIGELRSLLAATCIRALEPDLVILDEFQRFKDLLTTGDDESEAAEEAQLARELFDYTHEAENTKTKILLLSATPYKMYTTADDGGTDDHYADFLQTIRFLYDNSARTDRVAALLNEYRGALYRIGNGVDELRAIRERLEQELRVVIVRTERLAASPDRNGMLREFAPKGITLQQPDVKAYRHLQQIARKVDQPDTVEYWKAAPYLLSFMDEYLLKQKIEGAINAPGERQDRELVDLISAARDLFVPEDLVHGRSPAMPPHPRLRWLIDTCLNNGSWNLLWLPATMPYYAPAGVFAHPGAESATKRLVFSSWQVVPKAVAALVSYEAERRMLEGTGAPNEDLTSVRERLVPLLRINRDEDGRPTGMPVLALMYPSFVLAEIGDPYAIALDHGGVGALDRDAMLSVIEERISSLFDPVLERYASNTAAVDESWYWAAPILFDAASSQADAEGWLGQKRAATEWSGVADEENKNEQNSEEVGPWSEHVAQARSLLSGEMKLGRPPQDLSRVLAQLALAGPAVSALRALARVTHGVSAYRDHLTRTHAGRVAWSFRNLFNLPEAIALVRRSNAEEPYWRRVLEYMVDGNLQSVLDEYCHLLRDWLGLVDKPADVVTEQIVMTIRRSLALRTAAIGVDELQRNSENGNVVLKKQRMRARFAVRFGDEVEVEGERANRKDRVRDSFNSPFWPFVLATTSVGQEGLDFHLYCHSVVHWNLPSNPVDLEQREGRVHRFKGHAVRKNVVARHGRSVCAPSDPWQALFETAKTEREADTDIVPYWVYPVEGGAAIERHVPTLPLSRDVQRLQGLRRALVLYRMVFGQPRQDELLDYLLSQMTAEQATARLDELRVDLAPV